jgi:hypothetical protein
MALPSATGDRASSLGDNCRVAFLRRYEKFGKPIPCFLCAFVRCHVHISRAPHGKGSLLAALETRCSGDFPAVPPAAPIFRQHIELALILAGEAAADAARLAKSAVFAAVTSKSRRLDQPVGAPIGRSPRFANGLPGPLSRRRLFGPPGPSERWTITVSVQWPNL